MIDGSQFTWSTLSLLICISQQFSTVCIGNDVKSGKFKVEWINGKGFNVVVENFVKVEENWSIQFQ